MLEYHGGKIYDLVLSRGSKSKGGANKRVAPPPPSLKFTVKKNHFADYFRIL